MYFLLSEYLIFNDPKIKISSTCTINIKNYIITEFYNIITYFRVLHNFLITYTLYQMKHLIKIPELLKL